MLHKFYLLTVSWFESLANTGGDRPMASQHIQKANMASTHPRSLILNHDATCASVCSTDQIYYKDMQTKTLNFVIYIKPLTHKALAYKQT